jgi:hypothetical protein
VTTSIETANAASASERKENTMAESVQSKVLCSSPRFSSRFPAMLEVSEFMDGDFTRAIFYTLARGRTV